MRTDLNMRKGKMISQGAHASLGVILGMMHSRYDQAFEGLEVQKPTEVKELYLFNDWPITDWIAGDFTKITVGVNSEEELMKLYTLAFDEKLPVKLITDNGTTEFKGIKTKTCIAIGPGYEEDIDKITGHLDLI